MKDGKGGITEGEVWSFSIFDYDRELLKWKFKTESNVNSSPAIGEDGTVYVGSSDRHLHALTLEGKLKWKYKTGDSILSSPVIGEDGTIYVGSGDNHLYALAEGGFLIWKYETGWCLHSNPSIGNNGTIYIGSWDSNVYAISASGDLKWKFETYDLVRSSPSIGPDGTIYVGSWDDHVYAIKGYSKGIADSSWPTFRRDFKNSANICEKIPNLPPFLPSDPYPINNASRINVNPVLKWECSDLEGDSLTYDIYIGTDTNPPFIEIEYTNKIYSPGPLFYNTTYYWKIVAKDEKGGITVGPLWKLTTKESLDEVMALVKGGTFQIGDTWGDGAINEKPVCEVTLTYNFLMSKYEITNEEYVEFLNDKRINSNGSNDDKELIDMDDEHCQVKYNGSKFYIDNELRNKPVIEVSWWGAIEYCNWLSEKEGLPKAYDEEGNLLDKNGNKTTDISKVQGYRLPTEAEWEYAARGGNKSNGYKYSGSNNLNEVAWHKDNSQSHTHEVGTKKPNELGIYDMTGNVWEWCQDWYYSDYYESISKHNPYNHETGSARVQRGGSWGSNSDNTRIAKPLYSSPDYTGNSTGYRVCRTAF